MKICTVSEVRALDRLATEKFGIGAGLLMENAGQAVYHVISREHGVEGKGFVVFCGVGHNGGDGLVVARLLHANGATVQVFVLSDPGRFDGPARLNFAIVSRMPVDVREIRSVSAARAGVERCDGIVDAILGTGLTRDITGLYREIIELINSSGRTVFSVDIPSGVHGDTAAIMGAAVRADYTVTFGLAKTGNMLSPGHSRCGKLFVCHISFPPSLYETNTALIEINDPTMLTRKAQKLPGSEPAKVLFIEAYSGRFKRRDLADSAYRLAARVLDKQVVPAAIIWRRDDEGEKKLLPVPLPRTRRVSLRNKQKLLELSQTVGIVFLGTGLSRDKETAELVQELVGRVQSPLIIAGEVVSAFEGVLRSLKEREAQTILILNEDQISSIAQELSLEADAHKVETVRQAARRLSVTVVFHDVHSLIAFPDTRVFINMSGARGVATGRSTEILAGVIAALFELRLGPDMAVRKGVFVEGLAADLAVEEKGEHRAAARGILHYLPRAVRMILQGPSVALRERYEGARIV